MDWIPIRLSLLHILNPILSTGEKRQSQSSSARLRNGLSSK